MVLYKNSIVYDTFVLLFSVYNLSVKNFEYSYLQKYIFILWLFFASILQSFL